MSAIAVVSKSNSTEQIYQGKVGDDALMKKIKNLIRNIKRVGIQGKDGFRY